MNWKFFVGACILAGGLVLPYAPWIDVVAGIALATAFNLVLQRRAAHKPPRR